MRSKNGRLGKHDTTIVGDQFGVKIRTVQRIWQQGKDQLVQNIIFQSMFLIEREVELAVKLSLLIWRN
jgi:hypothetical protein